VTGTGMTAIKDVTQVFVSNGVPTGPDMCVLSGGTDSADGSVRVVTSHGGRHSGERPLSPSIRMLVALYVENGAVNGSAHRTTRTNATSLLNTAEALRAVLMPIRPQLIVPDS
jgi:hypothetical protein